MQVRFFFFADHWHFIDKLHFSNVHPDQTRYSDDRRRQYKRTKLVIY